MSAALRAEGLVRVFSSGAGEVRAVDGVDLELVAGELLVVRGASGAGKTTLLNLLGVLDRPTEGRVVIGDRDTTGLSESALADIRRDMLGFVFQSFGLVPVLSARENVELPLRIAGVSAAERTERVDEALALVGLSGQADQRPAELSGGQQQRVGIARAVVARPRILIADEPTGQLDSRTAATIMDLLGTLAHEQGLAAIVSTHDPLLVARADRIAELHNGRLTLGGGPGGGPRATRAVGASGGSPASDLDSEPEVEAAAASAAEPIPATAADASHPLTRAELRRRRTGAP
ncbi:MAG: ABC transporter [Microbacterium sp. SCN 70-27]|uniref:ABC transporter ATP-binding protein n=1 Tax=unclassified Microbacterium TaxID=2609290 RepID=UPI00086E1F50|nr:ABC transporter ATP-binding protein [Microbacterium sp.]ODT28784.1 MAG: ABC transporter [Microbacterium sp. SCN 70-27]